MAYKLNQVAAKLFVWLLKFCICCAIAWLAFSYLLPQDLSGTGAVYSPLVMLSFFGRVFTFHMGIALGVAAVAALLVRRRGLMVVSAIAMLACVAPTLYACRPRGTASVNGSTARVMSINLMFDNTDHDAVLRQVRIANPDVLILEEYELKWDDALRPVLEKTYPHMVLAPRKYSAGLAVYSKRPFTETPRTDVHDLHSQIRTAITINGSSVAIYAVHPAAPLNRDAIIRNRLQVLDYLTQMANEHLPSIMAGDWNFTAETANAAALNTAGLTDAFDIAGFGRGSTWPVLPRYRRFLPGVRIDHIYLTDGLTCTHFQNGGFDGSDHLPIIADVGFAKP